MKFSDEIINKARQAKSTDELLALAKENGMEMSAQGAADLFAQLHKTGELSDDELGNVAGGCEVEVFECKYSVGQMIEYSDDGKYHVGIIVGIVELSGSVPSYKIKNLQGVMVRDYLPEFYIIRVVEEIKNPGAVVGAM